MPSLFESFNALTHARTPNNLDSIKRLLAAGNVELQIQPQALGRPIEDSRAREYNGHKLFPVRYPRDSSTDTPDWGNPSCPWPLDYADRIGSTGHSESGSVFVGFDVDTLAGHAPGVGVSDEERGRIREAVKSLPYVEVRHSTGGAGLHLIVWLAGFATKNHAEHAALARATAGKISHDAQIDFVASVDACGGNMWLYCHDPKPTSFQLLQESSQVLTPNDLPSWEDHIEVVTRKRVRVHVAGLDTDDSASQPSVTRDPEHDKILAEYRKHGSLEWLPDHQCYRGHTAIFATVHKALKLKGAFETLSEGRDLGEWNCFAFLKSDGALFIVRYGDTSEHPLWGKTTKGAQCIEFNVPLNADTVCRAVGATPAGPGKFTCDNVEMAKQAAKLLAIELPEISDRPINFTVKGKNLTVEADRKGKEAPKGWAIATRKLRRHFGVDAPSQEMKFDHLVRYVQTQDRKDAGWLFCREDATWGMSVKDNCKDRVRSKLKVDADYASAVLGECLGNPWTLVVEPLQPEFLPGRRWNPNVKRLIEPTQSGTLSHPHYDMILQHCGAGLDDAVSLDPWCDHHGIRTGAAYLQLWAASMIRRPKVRLPYLFLWSRKNNTGKSALHRALAKLFVGIAGAVDVYLCLMEKFNQAMAGCVLGYIEDKGLNPAAYERLKGWIDSPTISIREMQMNSYIIPNYSHLIHTANHLDACPLQPEDERVVVIGVSRLKEDIAWDDKMSPALDKEAPDFLATLLKMQFPPAVGRLFLPVLETPDKRILMGTDISTDRQIVISDLVTAIVELVNVAKHWKGTAADLLKAIGDGPWSNSPPTLSSYLNDAINTLYERRIGVSISDTQTKGYREINIGQLWLIDRDWSDEELAADEVRLEKVA